MNGESTKGRRRGGRRAGTIATEIALVFVILGLAGWLGLELLASFRQRQRCQAFATELREFEATLRRFPPHPATIGPGGALPRTTADALAAAGWSAGSPFGGNYEWAPPARSAPARLGTIAVTAFAPAFPLSATRADLLRVDRMIDDGDLATGRFRTGFNGWPVFHLDDPR